MTVRNCFVLAAALLVAALGVAQASDPRAPSGPLVVNERWPRATDLRTWTQDVMRLQGVEKASETDQGKAFFQWLRLFCRMAVGGMIQAHEGEYAKERYVVDAHKNLFVYGWGYCDTCSRIADAAWKEYKQDAAAADRVVVQNAGGGFHTMYRLRLDGNFGAFDPRYGYYLLDRDSPNARILDWADVGQNVVANKNYQNRSRPFFEYFGQEWDRTQRLKPVYYRNQTEWEKAGSPLESVFGDSHYKMGTRFHDMSFRLPKGTVITRYWDNSARAFYRPVSERANRELPFLPSGRFYRVTETMFGNNWQKHDPNYEVAKPYLTRVPKGEGYDSEMEGGLTIGQAWGSTEYRPDLGDPALLEVLTPGSTLVQSSSAPYLRPQSSKAGGSAIFDFYNPYILVDGELDATVSGPTSIEIRTMLPKPNGLSDQDEWSEWQKVSSHGRTALGRQRFNGRDVSIHGVYRFQVRVTVAATSGNVPAGLNTLRLTTVWENGIMSLPRVFEGSNRIRFELRDASLLRAPVQVTYRYQTSAGEKAHVQTLSPADFHAGSASYLLNTPGLLRCNSVTVAY